MSADAEGATTTTTTVETAPAIRAPSAELAEAVHNAYLENLRR